MSDTPPLKPATLTAEVKSRTVEDTAAESKWSRLARHVPSGEQILSFLRTLVWVAPLTLLVWIYAEREQTVTVSSAPFPIEVKTTAANQIVTLSYPQDGMLMPDFSGPRAKIDKVREMLVPRADGGGLQLFIDPQFGPGLHELLTVNQLNNHAVFKNNGITVKSCNPPFLKVRVDVVKTDDLPVVVPEEVRKLLKEDPVITPARVKVQAPSQDLDEAARWNKYYVVAQIKPDQLRNKTGTITLENVPVEWFYKDHVLFATQTVKVMLPLRQSDVEFKIASLPVQQIIQPSLDLGALKVETNTTIPNVTVIGPPDEIEKIKRDPGQHVLVRLPIHHEAVAGQQREGALEFKLPAGVRPSDETLERAKRWPYTLVKRQ